MCVNQSDDSNQSCVASGASELYKYAKQQISNLGLKDKGVRLSSAGCLGNCKLGPILVIYPAGNWYSYQTKDDIDKILSSI